MHLMGSPIKASSLSWPFENRADPPPVAEPRIQICASAQRLMRRLTPLNCRVCEQGRGHAGNAPLPGRTEKQGRFS
jgi:hypothetical protein